MVLTTHDRSIIVVDPSPTTRRSRHPAIIRLDKKDAIQDSSTGFSTLIHFLNLIRRTHYPSEQYA